MLNTVLFDLDATLVPFQQKEFFNTYIDTLLQAVIPMGYPREALQQALGKGFRAMVKNDSARTNREMFWDAFCAELGPEAAALEERMDAFYRGEFDSVRRVVREQVDRRELILSLRRRGYTVVLATSPCFPECAVATRASWAGLVLSDFHHVTTYENCRRCKPYPAYYRELLATLGKEAEECVMLGNHPDDDMSAMEVGIPCRLITDYLENPRERDISRYEQMTFREAEQWLMSLPDLNK